MQRLDSVLFPEPRKLFPSEQAAHDAMLSEISDAIAELQAEGVEAPEFRRFYRDCRRLWSIWRHYA